jgi:hypothetical protein
MTGSDRPSAPAGLKAGGRAFWRATTAQFELNDHEMVIMKEMCCTIDLLDGLQAVVDAEGVVLPWGDGIRAHPALPELRQHRIALARLLVALGIAGEEEDQLAAPRRQRRGGSRGVYRLPGSA